MDERRDGDFQSSIPKFRQLGRQVREEFLEANPRVECVQDPRVVRMELAGGGPVGNQPCRTTDEDYSRTSTVLFLGIRCVKFPVLASQSIAPMDMINFAPSTFSRTTGLLIDPT